MGFNDLSKFQWNRTEFPGFPYASIELNGIQWNRIDFSEIIGQWNFWTEFNELKINLTKVTGIHWFSL